MYRRTNWGSSEETQNIVVKTQEVVQRESADSALLAPGERIPSDTRLVIPRLNVNVPIVFIESRDEEKIQKGLQSGVVHYQGTAMPGEVGNSFITGHSSNYWWDTGKFNYAFINLDKLKAGDNAVVYHKGKKYVYTVKNKVTVEPDNFSVLKATDTPTLSLMTCTPPGTSWKRLVVQFGITDPPYYKPETIIKEEPNHEYSANRSSRKHT